MSLPRRRRGIARGRLRAFSSKSHLLLRKKNNLTNKTKRKKFLRQDFSDLFFYPHPHSFFSFAVFSFFLFPEAKEEIDYIFPLLPIDLQAHVAAVAICSRSWSLLQGSWTIQAVWEMQSGTRTSSRLAACPVSSQPGWGFAAHLPVATGATARVQVGLCVPTANSGRWTTGFFTLRRRPC